MIESSRVDWVGGSDLPDGRRYLFAMARQKRAMAVFVGAENIVVRSADIAESSAAA
jgi:hypothetical protein